MMRMQVTSTEHGLIRLFSVDVPVDEIPAFNSGSLSLGSPLQDALGATDLDPARIELFDLTYLNELGLSHYLTEGLGIAERDITPDAARLDALTGHVLIVHSAAFLGNAQSLTPRAPLRWIGTYAEDAAQVSFQPLPTEAAKGVLATPPPTQTNPHLNVLWAILALPILALILGAVIYGVSR